MSISAYSEDSRTPLPLGQSGELVCDQHFPCQPLGFWPLEGYSDAEEADVKKARKRYEESYYVQVPGVWCECIEYNTVRRFGVELRLLSSTDHGDHVLVTESKDRNAGGVVMLGRSDGVL